MRSIPIDNRIYGGKLARVGDGIRGCSSARKPGEMEATAPRRTLKLSSSLRLHLLRPRHLHPLVLFTCFSFLFFFSVSLCFSLPFIPSSSFSANNSSTSEGKVEGTSRSRSALYVSRKEKRMYEISCLDILILVASI